LATAGQASEEQVHAAVAASQKAFATWKDFSDAEHAKWLRKLIDCCGSRARTAVTYDIACVGLLADELNERKALVAA
jgi:acyl-CoA reductase-like NAD-dependent aldehyde dehydrogenase